LWISFARDSYTRSLIEQAGEFTFVTLHYNQAGIAVACGTRSGRDTDKCAALDLYQKDRFLFLHGAIASVACKVVQSVPVDDHVLYIAHILHGDCERGRGEVRNLLVSDLKKQ
jgi:flavin reductase (DIM6/NTAB) family NADH-FMN oxidoreductase RutF